MEFFLLSLLFFFLPAYFFFFLVILGFFMMTNFSWWGVFLYVDSLTYLLLFFMMMFILGLVFFSESNSVLIILSSLLVIFSMMFFFSSNFLMLYAFFELSVFPILLMIMGFGYQIEKIGSLYYLLFYSIFCSMPFFYVYYNVFFFFSFCYFDFFVSWEFFFVLSLMFMMKFPIFFFHLWLPKAHVEAPTTASMLLAGLLLKLGTTGFLRIMKSMNFIYSNWWVFISFLGMLVSIFICFFQSDVKSLAAYSSITHMSFLLMCLVFIYLPTKLSSLLLMLGHGYVSSLLFFYVGEFYYYNSTRMIYYFNGFFSFNIFYSMCLSMVLLSNVGFPLTMNFFSEFFSIVSGMFFSKVIFLVLFMYFFCGFYYSCYLLVLSFSGSYSMNLNLWKVYQAFFLLIMCLNVFWLSLMN
uniref:NADH-ubiquinone oxidoreductase chain 4 n=1 Tax=Dictyocaulus viviparus TaxID=29172 RepID=A0A1E1GIK5_DICVI|nr:NADH dehydrogenase subunit 4 [Dictyocaulus viviparus]